MKKSNVAFNLKAPVLHLDHFILFLIYKHECRTCFADLSFLDRQKDEQYSYKSHPLPNYTAKSNPEVEILGPTRERD